MKQKLFMKIPDEARRSKKLVLRVNESEFIQLTNAAEIRHLTVSEYLRRIGMGRKADVNIEAKIIVEIRNSVMAIRDLHQLMTSIGEMPLEEEWRKVIQDARYAIRLVGDL